MNDFLEKLSPYNIFNYLLPGIVFVVLAEGLTTFHFIQQDIIIGVFFYYFIGLIISRIGSITIEPFLKWSGFVKFTPYADFVFASKEDNLINELSEANNMYRTFCSLFISLIILKIYELLSIRLPILGKWIDILLIVGLLALFCISYRKQTQYVVKRIKATIEKD